MWSASGLPCSSAETKWYFFEGAGASLPLQAINYTSGLNLQSGFLGGGGSCGCQHEEKPRIIVSVSLPQTSHPPTLGPCARELEQNREARSRASGAALDSLKSSHYFSNTGGLVKIQSQFFQIMLFPPHFNLIRNSTGFLTLCGYGCVSVCIYACVCMHG